MGERAPRTSNGVSSKEAPLDIVCGEGDSNNKALEQSVPVWSGVPFTGDQGLEESQGESVESLSVESLSECEAPEFSPDEKLDALYSRMKSKEARALSRRIPGTSVGKVMATQHVKTKP